MAFYTDGVVPWNSLDNNTRGPLASELESGYPCGEADQQLFNWTAGWTIGNIWNMLLQSGITPDVDKLLDLARAIQTGKVNYAVAAGTANARTATLSPVPTSYIDGMGVTLRIAATNSAAATLNLNGLGAIPITLVSGSALTGGEIPAMAEFVIFNNTAMLVNPKPSVVTGIGGYQNIEAATNTTLPTNNVAVAVPWASATGSQSVFGTISGSVFTFTVAGRYFLSSQMQISVTGTPAGQFAAAIAKVIKNNGLPGQGTITTMGDDLTLISGTATTSYLSGVGALDAAVGDTLILTGQEFIASGGTYTTGNIAVASITLLRTQ
ncbi:hypothetical protein [Agrobacterium tumefaciens]|uniref:hypothetical protein n=1 Tax=Agrobacterium tumefaciens TaxID=358 RepID=UPI000557A373|nr:hypothetical protein [Agrobacterium tumefaciens]